MNYSFAIVLAIGILGFFMVPPARAEDIFISQTAQGDDSGANAANAHSTAWFNAAANWGAGLGKISPGDTVHLCGTISTALTVRGEGVAGSRIRILFEPGARISMPSLPSTGGLALGNYSYLTIDGGTDGIIECTANGSGMGQVDSTGIRAGNGADLSRDITIKDLTIRNLYVRTNNQDQVDPAGIYVYNILTNFLVQNCTISWCAVGISLAYNAGSSYDLQIVSNRIEHVNWGGVVASANSGGCKVDRIVIAGNVVNHFEDWDNPGLNSFHHNGFFSWADHSGALITNVWVTNNIIGGSWGNPSYATAGISFSSDPVGLGVWNVLIANNLVFATNGGWANGAVRLLGVRNSLIANNTFYGGARADLPAVRCEPTCSGVTFSNNIFQSFGEGYYLIPYSSSKPTGCDNNIYYNVNLIAHTDSGITYPTFSQWQSFGFDTASLRSDPKLVSPGSGDFHLQSSSPAIGAAAVLSSLFSTDIDGRMRGSAWDVGAYEYSSSIAPPENLRRVP